MADGPRRSVEKRQRDATATRDAILASAKICFTVAGFEQVGVREIAERAGVTAALINRYFGSKEALFGEVLDSGASGHSDLGQSFQALLAERDRFGERLARRVLSHKENRSQFDPMLVILRSVGQPAAEIMLRERLALWFEPIASKVGGPDAAITAEMILATLAGFDLFRNVLKSPAMSSADEDRLVRLLGAALQAFLDPAVQVPIPSETVRHGSGVPADR